MSFSTSGKLHLHSLSTQGQALSTDSFIVCVTVTPNEGVEEDIDACAIFQSFLEDSVLHHFAQKHIESSDTAAVKRIFIKSILEAALKVIETDAPLPDDTLMPDPELTETDWEEQTEFETAMLDTKHYLVGMRSDESFVAKEFAEREITALGPHNRDQCLAFCGRENR